MLIPERLDILSKMSNGLVHDLFNVPIVGPERETELSARNLIVCGYLAGEGLIEIVEYGENRARARITPAGLKTLRESHQ